MGAEIGGNNEPNGIAELDAWFEVACRELDICGDGNDTPKLENMAELDIVEGNDEPDGHTKLDIITELEKDADIGCPAELDGCIALKDPAVLNASTELEGKAELDSGTVGEYNAELEAGTKLEE